MLQKSNWRLNVKITNSTIINTCNCAQFVIECWLGRTGDSAQASCASHCASLFDLTNGGCQSESSGWNWGIPSEDVSSYVWPNQPECLRLHFSLDNCTFVGSTMFGTAGPRQTFLGAHIINDGDAIWAKPAKIYFNKFRLSPKSAYDQLAGQQESGFSILDRLNCAQRSCVFMPMSFLQA